MIVTNDYSIWVREKYDQTKESQQKADFQGGDLCELMEKGPIKPIALVISWKFWIMLLVINSNCVDLIFQGGDWYEIMKGDSIKPISLLVLWKFGNLLVVSNANCEEPVFPGGDLCEIMERYSIKPIASVDSCTFTNLLVVINSSYVVPVFQGGVRCEIMERRPHKTNCISGFSGISKTVGCIKCKLCDPRFPRGWFVWHNGKRNS